MPLNESGMTIPTLSEVIATIEAGQELIFPDIIFDDSSPDKQLNGLFAEVIMTSYEVALGIYNGLDPRTAAGIMLDRVSALSGVVRQPGSPTVVELTYTSSGQYIDVPPGSIFEDDLGNQFTNEERVYNLETVLTGPVVALNDGATEVLAGELTTIVTPIPTLASVTNLIDGVPGTDPETDSQLRIRRERSVAYNSTALIDSMYAQIGQVDGVTDLAVYENATGTITAEGIPPHSLYVVAEGGTDNDIATAIMHSKSLGSALHGTEQVTWVDSQGFDHSVHFDRPAEIPIFINITVSHSPNYGPGIEAEIKDLIMAYIEDVQTGDEVCVSGALGIGDEVFASIFYAAISGHEEYAVQSIFVGTTAIENLNSIPMAINEKGTYLRTDIGVTEV